MPFCAIPTLALLTLQLSPRPPDIPFAIHPIDLGASETAAVADINRDGRLDIVSGEHWYQAPALSSSKGPALSPSKGPALSSSNGPAWTKHRFRELGFSNNYVDNFSDLTVDVDADGYPDVVSVAWFAKKIAWWRNPGPSTSSGQASSTSSGQAGLWTETAINTGFNVEFAILADVDNDGRAHEIVAQENGTGQSWYEIRNKAWVRHVVSDRTYGHGIGAGDVNGDKRHDILTPRGWLEAPADPRSGNWTFHSVWEAINVPATPSTGSGQALSTGSGQAPAPPKPGASPRVSELGFMHVFDVNADGRNDVVTAAGHDYGVYWFEQGADGQWMRRSIDGAWSQGHASTLVDFNGDGQQDFVTGKRFMAHNGSDPGEKEPLGVYWYERRTSGPALEWVRHIVDYGGRMGGGMQLPVADIDGDGDLDLVCPGKSGLFLVENLTKGPRLTR